MTDNLKIATDKLIQASFSLMKDQYTTVEEIANYFIDIGVDRFTDGFWLIDFRRPGYEYYSPKFREILGFDGEKDFPNVSESWKKHIHPESLIEAERQFENFITKGSLYEVLCKYIKKDKSEVLVLCEGSIIASSDNGAPLIMFGKHHVI